MATGLEALGAASAVISLISFAGSLASLTMKIYDGIPTAEDELEDYATRMLDAAQRVKSRQVPRGTPVNDKLSEVGQKCIDAARELENATRKISTQKGNRLKAFYSASFSAWLPSDDKLFWIRGKPGSGKSTLIKFVVNNDNTKRLLGSWHPNTRILSHFFWKIGSEPQNSTRGLLCSLLYNLLSEDDDAIEKALREFKFSELKDFYKEWSSQEAEKVLCYLLDTSAHKTCIFVDGLDEISDEDGYQALLSVVQRLTTCRGVKICVSSRPEAELVRRLENIGVQNLRLDDLSHPEMAIYLQKEFEELPKEKFAHLPLEEFTKTLLGKAQGVFLWLALASKSVTSGILNGDDQETLSQRLEELPEKLKYLYQTMWERLNGRNQIYRETAARYFRHVIADGWRIRLGRKECSLFIQMDEPNLAQLSLAVKAEDGLIFPPKANEMKLSDLDALCVATENDIQTRCAGMLQIGRHSDLKDRLPDAMCPLMRRVQFIHRTAHDFLVDTGHGQSILNYGSNETKLLDEGLKLLKCWLHLVNTYYRELEVMSDCHQAVFDCNRLNDKGANPEAILAILRIIKDLYEDNALFFGSPFRKHISFPCVAAFYLDRVDDFVISSFMPTPTPELSTSSLHELALASQYMSVPSPHLAYAFDILCAVEEKALGLFVIEFWAKNHA
ncbi:hypothetical protein FBULB1_7037 [Fusarium bulbicola]|nr:hypothetical protein FBULB1_7037 [Fusarium bulbicola]